MPITTIPTKAVGGPVDASWANDLRDNDVALDARTGGDPGGADKWLVSTGSLGATWVARLTAVLAAIGYTPANKAGETFTGAITAPSPLTVQKINDAGAGGRAILKGSGAAPDVTVDNATNIVQVYNSSDATKIWQFFLATGAFSVSGALSAASAALTGALTAASATLSGALSAASASISGLTATGTLTASGTVVGSSTVQGTQMIASVSDSATAPFTAHANQAAVTCTNLKAADAAALGAVAASGYPRRASGSYAGTGGTGRQITTGFVPKYVRLTGKNAGSTLMMTFDLVAPLASVGQNLRTAEVAGATHMLSCGETYIHASDGFNVNGAGIDNSDGSGVTYYWIALG